MEQNSDQTETIINTFIQRLGNQDAEGLSELFAEEIDWFVPGNEALPWIGHRSRRAEVADYFRTMWPHFEPGKSKALLDKNIIAGNDAVMLASFTHTAALTGRSWQTEVALHFKVVDGKITKMHLYEDTLAVSNAFFS